VHDSRILRAALGGADARVGCGGTSSADYRHIVTAAGTFFARHADVRRLAVLGRETRIELAVEHDANAVLRVQVADDLHPALAQLPPSTTLSVFPRDSARITFTVTPNRRGDFTLGPVWLRWSGRLRLAERRAICEAAQKVRVYPTMERSADDTALYLLRIRQIELQRRRLRLTGTGREFDHLRDYSAGDELRNISWPATARRAKVVTREFTTERSQQVWIVVDAGRLSGTVFEMRHATAAARSAHPASFRDAASDESFLLSLTQLDQACSAGIALAQTVMQAGDKAGLLVYGRAIQQQLLPATGANSLRVMIDSLSQARVEGSEADHLRAAARLGQLQRRRSLVLWITRWRTARGVPILPTPRRSGSPPRGSASRPQSSRDSRNSSARTPDRAADVRVRCCAGSDRAPAPGSGWASLEGRARRGDGRPARSAPTQSMSILK